MNISNQLQSIKGIGPQTIAKLAKIGISNTQDLLFHLPIRYEDRTQIIPIRNIRVGQHVLVEGIVDMTEIQFRGRRSLLCHIKDNTGRLTLRFFHFNVAQQKGLIKGTHLRCFGEVRFGNFGLEMIHPEYRQVSVLDSVAVDQHLTPVYSTTEKLHQFILRKLINNLLEQFEKEDIEELLPLEVLQKFNFPSLKESLLFLHHPQPNVSIDLLSSGQHLCQKRLIFEELLAHYLSLRQLRIGAQKFKAISLTCEEDFIDSFIQKLPFSLTSSQKRVFKEICDDISKPNPMLRLMQGDVGSGKTIVGALSALIAVKNNCQVAFMAPTELLARQHLENFKNWFEPLNISVVLLTSQSKGKRRESILKQIENGVSQIVIGTHALFQEDVKFNRLALVIIDEQHRFGVHQRLLLREKGVKNSYHPHQLIMTATPIPRTLAMSAYADLDHSVIDELPKGRISVKTIALSNERREEIIKRIRVLCKERKQVYWVCTLIEESEILQCKAAEDTAKSLSEKLKELRIGLVHGQMKSKEKDQIMLDFKNGKYDILVATTVIEVGIDVKNAVLMVIENAERLGLSQLHQLRGRVGRGHIESHCVLLYQNPLSILAKRRLEIMRTLSNGFFIAEKDLELRGPGEVLGTKQTGLISMRVANLVRDQYLLQDVYKVASIILQKHPEKIPLLTDRWISCSEQYGNV